MEKNKINFTLFIFILIFSTCILLGDTEPDDNNSDGITIQKPLSNVDNDTVDSVTVAAPSGDTAFENTDELIENTRNGLNLYYIVSFSVFLLLISLIVFSHLFFRKMFNSKIKALKNELHNSIKMLESRFVNENKSINKNVQSSSINEDLRPAIAAIEKKINSAQNEVNLQIQELQTMVNTLYSGKKLTESIISGELNAIDAFNLWAANPAGPLPEAFFYITGEMNIRTEREIRESADETKWIINRNGTQKYILPNPNFFNQMTNILELYKMDQAKLKGRGQNKFKIIRPCEITKDGFVEFSGELELL